MAEPGYSLSVPLSKTQWVRIVSNKPMTAESFRALHRYLALQREMVLEKEPTP
jgi:hypothetical protein